MYLCILSASGETALHRNVAARPEPLLKAVAPYRDGLVAGAECMFDRSRLHCVTRAHSVYCQ